MHCRDHYLEIRCLQRQRTPSVVDGAPHVRMALAVRQESPQSPEIAQPLLGDIIFHQLLDWLTESHGVQAMLLADLETCAMSRGVVFQHDLPILL